jgi:hypothetical protein
LPLHPALAALGLPPGPWSHEASQTGNSRSCEIWDTNDTEVVWVTGYPERKVGDELGPMREVAMTAIIANVVAAAPEMLSLLLYCRDWFRMPVGTDSRTLYEELSRNLDPILARALGQEGGRHE